MAWWFWWVAGMVNFLKPTHGEFCSYGGTIYGEYGSRVGIKIARWFLVRYVFFSPWYGIFAFDFRQLLPSESQLMVNFRYDVDSELIDRWLNQSGQFPLRWWFGLMLNILSQQARAQAYQKVTCKLKMNSPMFWYRSFTITQVSKAQKACFINSYEIFKFGPKRYMIYDHDFRVECDSS